jgi:hypothetical protein
MTASERAAEINARDPDDGFKLVEDAAHWAGYGIHTAEELDHYLNVEGYINLYKDRHGIKPRWMDFSKMTADEVVAMIHADFPPEVEKPPAPPKKDDSAPLTHSPFAGLKLKS